MASEFDTEAYRRTRSGMMRPEFAWDKVKWQAFSPEQRTEWQNRFRRRFDELLGNLNAWQRVPLDARIVAVQQCDGYKRETVTFATRPGLRACGYFLTPDNIPPMQRAILCLPGHGVGVDGIVGLVPEDYSADFALQCVRQGCPTFALEQIGFGRRRDAEAIEQGERVSSCSRDSAAALMLGETMAGWRVWDAMRALDYMTTRTEAVDPACLTVMGISGGGLTALFAAALDVRIAACVVSGYFNTFAGSILAVNHCIDNYVPGLLTFCEMPDLAALIAPRALLVENGRETRFSLLRPLMPP